METLRIQIKKDGDGYLATIIGKPTIFAWGETKDSAKQGLYDVVTMQMDYYLEQVEEKRHVINTLFAKPHHYAI